MKSVVKPSAIIDEIVSGILLLLFLPFLVLVAIALRWPADDDGKWSKALDP